MNRKIIKLVSILIIILFLLIGLSEINIACLPINQLLETKPAVLQDKNMESEIIKKLTELNLPESIRVNLLKALQEKPNLFDNIYSDDAFWEWLISNQSATSSDISIAIEIAAKDKFYSADFIDSLLKLNKEELLASLSEDAYLEKKYKDFLENLTESFFENNVLFYIDKQSYLSYFPEDTKELIFLPEKLQSSVKKIIKEALEIYPLGFVPQHLKKLFIIGNEIKIENENATALAIDKTVFLTNGGNNNEIVYLIGFHHEFNHVLQDTYKELFDSYYEDWQSNNPEGFEYYGYERYKDEYYNKEEWLKMYKDGFISSYSMVSYNEDLAEIASRAFANDPIFWKSIKNYPRIRQKFELMVDFYNKIDPSITLEYFEKISGQKLRYSK
ncbi:MAG: putative zinc-binding metallopeptidase [Candidatus Humimicrobiaceae bacterium]